jgi:hypothetical protein
MTRQKKQEVFSFCDEFDKNNFKYIKNGTISLLIYNFSSLKWIKLVLRN